MSAFNVRELLASGRLVLSVEEAAAALGVARSTAYQATRTGDLPSRRIGRRVVIPIASLLTWLGDEGVSTNGDGAHPTGPTEAGNDESAPKG